MFKLSATFTAALALAAGANAFFRLPCTDPLVQGALIFSSLSVAHTDYIVLSERVDPVVSPGITPSNHVHVRCISESLRLKPASTISFQTVHGASSMGIFFIVRVTLH